MYEKQEKRKKLTICLDILSEMRYYLQADEKDNI